MKPFVLVVLFAVAQSALLLRAEQPKSKAPDQGYVPEGWYPHEGGLLISSRDPLWRRARRDARWLEVWACPLTTDPRVTYVFHRGQKADAVVVFDQGKLPVPGSEFLGNPHGHTDKDDNIWRWTESPGLQVHARRQAAANLGHQDRSVPTTRPSTVRRISLSQPMEIFLSRMATAIRGW